MPNLNAQLILTAVLTGNASRELVSLHAILFNVVKMPFVLPNFIWENANVHLVIQGLLRLVVKRVTTVYIIQMCFVNI